MRETANYKFQLPEGNNFVSPEQYNANFTALDTKLKEVDDEAKKVAAHKHSAGDITSGVMASARLPYLTDGSRFGHQTDITYVNQSIAAGSSATVTIPFWATLPAVPAKVILHVQQGRPSTIGAMLHGAVRSIVAELFPRGNSVDGWVFGATGGEGAAADGFTRVYLRGMEDPGEMIQFYRVTSDVWYGPFGNAFVTSATNIEVKVDSFRVTASGVTFTIRNTGSNLVTAYFGAYCDVIQ